MTLADIGYVYEPVREYEAGLTAARDRRTLLAHVDAFRPIAADACAAVEHMSARRFGVFRRGLLTERKGEFAGKAWAAAFGAIAMPAVMLHVSLIAKTFFVPWGTAYIRAREEGLIEERHGVAIWRGLVRLW